MLSTMKLLLLSCFVSLSLARCTHRRLKRDADCTVGEEFNKDGFIFLCYENDQGKGYRPIACLDTDGGRHTPGDEYSDKHFKYQCQEDGADAVKYEIISCYGPNQTPLAVPETRRFENDLIYICYRKSDGVVALRTEWAETCLLDDGREFSNGEVYEDEETMKVLKCELKNGKMTSTVKGCLTDDGNRVMNGKTVKFSTEHGDETWSCKNGVMTEFETHSCSVGDKDYKPGDEFIDGVIKYKCESTGSKYEAKAKACVLESNTSIEIKKWGSKVESGTRYYCNWSHKEVYEVGKGECSDGTKLYKYQYENDVAIRCEIHGKGQVSMREKWCVYGDNKALKVGQTKELDGKAYRCVKGDDNKMRREQLTQEEYDDWKAKQEAKKNSSSGSGRAGHDEITGMGGGANGGFDKYGPCVFAEVNDRRR